MASGMPARTQRPDPMLAESLRQNEVLRLIRDHGVMTRAEIGALLHTSASQVSRLTAPLIARRIVTVEPRLPYVEGRPTELLALAADTHYVVGLDVGGLAQDAVVTSLRGDVVGTAHASGPPPATRSAIIAGLVDVIDRAIGESAIASDQVLGIGVGVRAIIDPTSGVISSGPETPSWSPVWVDFDLRGALAQALPWNRLVIDDTVRALAAAERQYGHARGVEDFVYVLADSGIGAALMIGGRPYIGPGHLAGEIGHIMLDRHGPVCGCGRRGCVEMFASTSAMLARGQEIDPAIATIEQLIARGDSGDEASQKILDAGGAALGRAIAILINLLSPALVVIGGRATASGRYMEHARAAAQIESLTQPYRSARIVSSALEHNAGAHGAATLILDELFSTTGLPGARQSTPRYSPSSVARVRREGAVR